MADDENRIEWRLETPVVYDEAMKKRIVEQQTGEFPCVFWKKKKNIVVENPEFCRGERMNAYGIAGSSSVLFPGANVLAAGETGKCLLSADVAHKLFGSTNVSGRSVRIGERIYQVAGVEFQVKNLCVYELDPEAGEIVRFGGCWYSEEKDKYMAKQRAVMTVLNETG